MFQLWLMTLLQHLSKFETKKIGIGQLVSGHKTAIGAPLNIFYMLYGENLQISKFSVDNLELNSLEYSSEAKSVISELQIGECSL